ncbi:hypothetical protein ACEQ8H_001315 [Pleosporales sp. CAS-2024a]
MGSSSNYRVRFRHGVYPNAEAEATRADIKKYDYFFSCAQIWVGTPRHVDFIDESAQVAADLEAGEGAGESSLPTSKRLIRTSTAERIPPQASSSRNLLMQSMRPAPMHPPSQPRRYPSPATSSISSLDGASSSVDWPHEPSHLSPFPSLATARLPWPLSDPVEAHLFRVFVDTFAPPWDTTSPQCVFGNMVPHMALTDSMLLNAVFMSASHVIARTDASFPAKPFVYHERVLQSLIPYLAHHGRILDEPTLVTAMLLRGLEESHDDKTWANTIIWTCARILQWMMQTDVDSNQLDEFEWHTLKSLVDEWEHQRPTSFNPFFYREANANQSGQLPELWFPAACHADAHQYLCICRIALAVTDPRVGSRHLYHHVRRRPIGDAQDITVWLKEIMAVARCNPHASTTPYLAAHAMHKFAVVLRHFHDQNNVMNFLEEVDMIRGWPTAATRQWLRMEWAWPTMQEDNGNGNGNGNGNAHLCV